VDTGATANQSSNHPVLMAADDGNGQHSKNSGLKKKKRFLIF
jgi:hypothetical protein